ncbi:hypothetical protein KKG41_05775 [Patescibacteria group bacterium]|nr:hypothetical protein [Patescibacteria group bacterium]MBU1890696.1 hypothetical protein [Patescibacteria group bacterium]
MSTNQIVKHLKDLFSGFSEICIWGIPIVTIDFKNNYLSDCLEEEISKAVNKHKINKIPQVVLSTLTTPLKNTYNKKELIDILKLAEKKDLDDKDIKKHSDKYCWIDYGYQGPAKSLNYYKKRLAEIKKNKKSPLQQLKDIARNDRELQEQQKRLSQQLHLDKQNKYLCKVAREFMFLKSYRQAILSKVAYTYDLLFKELTKQYKVTTKQLHHCLQEEIFGLLMGNSLNMTEINQRINSYYVYSYINGKNRLYYGNKAKKIIQDNLYKEEVDRNTKIITGTTAYWGKVQGTVRVVNVAKEMNKVKKGDILVSLATNPTIISAMKKAAAFVTDAGGITCHAAIVAREMKKPCVIGTKFATKVLKDGDKIEVDADKGIVKKL